MCLTDVTVRPPHSTPLYKLNLSLLNILYETPIQRIPLNEIGHILLVKSVFKDFYLILKLDCGLSILKSQTPLLLSTISISYRYSYIFRIKRCTLFLTSHLLCERMSLWRLWIFVLIKDLKVESVLIPISSFLYFSKKYYNSPKITILLIKKVSFKKNSLRLYL